MWLKNAKSVYSQDLLLFFIIEFILLKITLFLDQVKHSHVFGCRVYADIPKDERKEMNPKVKKSIFLGYGSCIKGYVDFTTLKN